MRYPAYPQYVPTRWLEVGQIPAGWEARRLKFAVSLRNEKVDAESMNLDYMGLEHIEPLTGRRIDDETAASTGIATRFEKDDVLFGKLRPYLAKVYLADKEGMATTEALVMMADTGLRPVFLRYLLLSNKFIDAVAGSTYGAKMPRANWDAVGGLPILLPSLEEQQQIAAFLDWKTGQIDALIAKKQALIEKLKEKRLAVITQAVTKGLDPAAPLRDSGIPWLGQVPAHWNICQLKRVFRAVEYGISDALEPEGAIGVLRMGNIENGKAFLDNLKYVDSVAEDLLLQHGDLLYNRTNSVELIGKVGIFTGRAEPPISFASYLVRIRMDAECIPQYFAYLLNTDGILGVAKANAFIAIGQCNLNPSRYGQTKTAIPPKDEQQAIVSHLDSATGRLDSLAAKAQSAITRLTEYRAALITAATSGKIDVRAFSPTPPPPDGEGRIPTEAP